MTRIEIAKARALSGCSFGCWNGHRRFVEGLLWLVEHSPATGLSWRQQWFLDGLLWHYRKQLAGRELGCELPTAKPEEAHYRPERPPQPQANLFGEVVPVPVAPTPSIVEPARQKSLW